METVEETVFSVSSHRDGALLRHEDTLEHLEDGPLRAGGHARALPAEAETERRGASRSAEMWNRSRTGEGGVLPKTRLLPCGFAGCPVPRAGGSVMAGEDA